MKGVERTLQFLGVRPWKERLLVQKRIPFEKTPPRGASRLTLFRSTLECCLVQKRRGQEVSFAFGGSFAHRSLSIRLLLIGRPAGPGRGQCLFCERWHQIIRSNAALSDTEESNPSAEFPFGSIFHIIAWLGCCYRKNSTVVSCQPLATAPSRKCGTETTADAIGKLLDDCMMKATASMFSSAECLPRR